MTFLRQVGGCPHAHGSALAWTILAAVVGGLAACATPAPVKQAVKNQSEAYVLLDRSLQDFGTAVRGLQRDLAAVKEAGRRRECATAAIRRVQIDICGAENPISTSLQVSPQLKDYTDAIARIDTALRPPKGPQPVEIQIQANYEQFSQEQLELRKQIKALSIINATIADYYNIDLSPGPDATKALIESLKPPAQ